MMPGTEKWVWLSLALNIGTRKMNKLIDHFGSADAVYAAEKSAYTLVKGTVNDKDIEKLSDKSLEHTHKIISECEKKKIRVITPVDSEFPERLLNIPNPPTVLYARGERLCVDGEAVIAVVGTRRATKQGELAAKKIGSEIATSGGITVTGLARGIDSLAIEGALSAGGRTVAVLGCGADICYPRENKNLMEAIIKSGTVLSEYPPGTEPARQNFPRRNRIISGISLGTVVVEAPEKSGALITASYALEQGRDVFAVPSGIFEKSAVGSNRLIREGAIPVMSGRDVLTEYTALYGDKISLADDAKTPAQNAASLQRTLNESERTKFEAKKIEAKNSEPEKEFSFPHGYLEKFLQDDRAVLEAIRGDELRADDIARKSGLPMAKVLSLLTLLEIRGHIKQLAGGRFIIKDIQ